MIQQENKQLLDEIIIGRVKPHIYAFTTNTIPNYLKVGDTYRPVSVRLHEWMEHFPALKKEFEDFAIIGEDVFFRDYSVHQYLEQDLRKIRLKPSDFPEEYYSNEFFLDVCPDNVLDAISDIKENYKRNTGKYKYYDVSSRLPETFTYTSTGIWTVRPNQQKTIENFVKAVDSGRTNLLMYAVMRFGKSFTSLCCAKAKNYKTILVVSAKADVREEWKKTVQSADNFNKDYIFIASDDLLRDENIIKNTLKNGKRVVVFLTLQDLQGNNIKDKHKEVFGNQIDLLIVDETHYGARSESYGKVLRDSKSDNYKKAVKEKHADDDFIDTEEAEKQIKFLNVKITLHLSGTPYRILMGSEFSKEDIIAFYQFSDIVKDKEAWDKEHLLDDTNDIKEWDNPYYGFPQMVRFAFVPSKSALALLEKLKSSGTGYNLSELLMPQCLTKDNKLFRHKKFVHEKEVLELFEAIDGSKEDEGLLSFLDYDKIKDGNMCEHIVCVLPYCASCDALQQLLKDNINSFKNLQNYTIINISGVDNPNEYKDIKAVKAKIKQCADEREKTLTLTVNRMLTGSTVEQWDTMIFLKDTESPQEYDQAVFRLQNQYIREYINKDGDIIKFNMKPQTLLVDFDPHRMFVMQEKKSQIYNANIDISGNEHLKERLNDELRISPIITLNKNRIEKVTETDILTAISEYVSSRGVYDEISNSPVDITLFNNIEIKTVIEQQPELGSRHGLSIEAHQGKETDLEMNTNSENTSGNSTNDDTDKTNNSNSNIKTNNETESFEKKFRTYYSRILFFAFLIEKKVVSLGDIIKCIDDKNNKRIAFNLHIEKNFLEILHKYINSFVLSDLDYMIQRISILAHDETVAPMQRAMVAIRKFDRISESEITTPENITIAMVDLLPDECLYALRDDKNTCILDIASKMGEFAVAIIKRCQTLGIPTDAVKNKIYSIPTSSIAYEFTRKVYEVLGLDISSIAKQFTSYELLNIKENNKKSKGSENIDYGKIKKLLLQNKIFSEINIDDISNSGEANKMNFNAIVGNPPYQVDDGGAQASAKPIYNLFMNIAKQLNPRFITLIMPSRWMTGGKGLDKFRDAMIHDNSICELHDFADSKMCFQGVEIKGGVCYFLYDISYKGTCEVHRHDTYGESITNRYLVEGDDDIFIRNNELISIRDKVWIDKTQKTFSNIVSTQKPYGMRGDVFGKEEKYHLPKVSDEEIKGGYKVLGLDGMKRTWKFVPSNYPFPKAGLLHDYKIFITRNYGNGEMGEVPSNPVFASPGEACTETFIEVGPFKSEEEMNNAYSYYRTKFFRSMVAICKHDQSAAQKVYRFVPIQDWSKPWTDEELYKKYHLTDDEINFIESMIKPMDV